MIEVSVGLGERSYPIFIASNCLATLATDLKERKIGKKYAIITDSTVASLYGDALFKSLREEGIQAKLFPFPAGEHSKNLTTLAALASRLVQSGFDRHDALIALGGGVTGDITGFLASIYMRGIPFVQIPTTLLAQVDSSVGGKTGVDIPEGKNLIGTFYQPKVVYIDPTTLQTLSKDEYLAGLAEVIKYGLIYDADFNDFLVEHRRKIIYLEYPFVEKMIQRCCQIKAAVVEADEKEGNIRRILNFGHTLGHAVESASNFKISHGFSVSMGMYAAAQISYLQKRISFEESQLIYSTLSTYGLPTEIPKNMNRAQIKAYLKNDKKSVGGRVFFVLLDGIGKYHITDDVSEAIIDTVLQ